MLQKWRDADEIDLNLTDYHVPDMLRVIVLLINSSIIYEKAIFVSQDFAVFLWQKFLWHKISSVSFLLVSPKFTQYKAFYH